MNMCFFGSSLVSSHWNGAATYYRGLLSALAERGVSVRFYEPDAYERQRRRDIDDPEWARVIVYDPTPDGWQRALADAIRRADVLVKASGVGVFDAELEAEISRASRITVFWDVDAPATLSAIDVDPRHHLRTAIPRFDAVFTYGGGPLVVDGYRDLGARVCAPVHNAVDPATHHPTTVDRRFVGDLGLLANRLPDREARIEEFFLGPARVAPTRRFVLGGAGWEGATAPDNVRVAGHVGVRDHNSFFSSTRLTLNVNREPMAKFGHSPPTRIFEAAGTGACVVTDAWDGIDAFFEPDREIVVVEDGHAVLSALDEIGEERAVEIGRAARRRALAEHTYSSRADLALALLQGVRAARAVSA